jgi:hypothetical protein
MSVCVRLDVSFDVSFCSSDVSMVFGGGSVVLFRVSYYFCFSEFFEFF